MVVKPSNAMVRNIMVDVPPEVLPQLFPNWESSVEPPPGLAPAGVLLPLFYKDSELHLLFIQRTFRVKDHRGQIAFPGGVKDPQDADLLTTALRETAEEIGLKPQEVQILGALPAVGTVTGYWINAFVGLIPYPYDFQVNKREVQRLLFLPLSGFCPKERWSSGTYKYRRQTVKVCYWRQDDLLIWGATARLLLQLLSRFGEEPAVGCDT